MRKAAKRDVNEMGIARALRRAGCLVLFNHHPDLIVQHRGVIRLLEVKSRKGRLTDSQQKLIDDGWNLHIVRTVEEALTAVGLKHEA